MGLVVKGSDGKNSRCQHAASEVRRGVIGIADALGAVVRGALARLWVRKVELARRRGSPGDDSARSEVYSKKINEYKEGIKDAQLRRQKEEEEARKYVDLSEGAGRKKKEGAAARSNSGRGAGGGGGEQPGVTPAMKPRVLDFASPPPRRGAQVAPMQNGRHLIYISLAAKITQTTTTTTTTTRRRL